MDGSKTSRISSGLKKTWSNLLNYKVKFNYLLPVYCIQKPFMSKKNVHMFTKHFELTSIFCIWDSVLLFKQCEHDIKLTKYFFFLFK